MRGLAFIVLLMRLKAWKSPKLESDDFWIYFNIMINSIPERFHFAGVHRNFLTFSVHLHSHRWPIELFNIVNQALIQIIANWQILTPWCSIMLTFHSTYCLLVLIYLYPVLKSLFRISTKSVKVDVIDELCFLLKISTFFYLAVFIDI